MYNFDLRTYIYISKALTVEERDMLWADGDWETTSSPIFWKTRTTEKNLKILELTVAAEFLGFKFDHDASEHDKKSMWKSSCFDTPASGYSFTMIRK